ncbi:unnamed protein product [marine sediment metagenome]|uniref:IclR-ED domain-containing protein n=1 Tax=marine sediment metagenome TaxID=412755 RepID=X1EUD4_9ZZZZ
MALPFLELLNKMIGESVNLAIKDESEVVYIDHIASNQNLWIFTKVGNRVPLHSTGVSKVLLAYINDQEKELYLINRELPKFTESTITDLGRLKEELSQIKQEGVATDEEEFDVGVKCVAAPIKDATGSIVAAISVSGPSVCLNNQRLQELKSIVRTRGLEISQALGYQEKEQ